MTKDWVEWHRRYETDRGLARRLEVVQDRIRRILGEQPAGRVRVLSLCAGDGRDLLGALEDNDRAADVQGRLIELNPQLSNAGRRRAERAGITGLEFVIGDASNSSTSEGAAPADLVLACGIFGNISDSDIRGMISHLPELCSRKATVVWTRHRGEPDATPAIREWFRESGFAEVAFLPIPEEAESVGVHRLESPQRPFQAGVRLFTFTR